MQSLFYSGLLGLLVVTAGCGGRSGKAPASGKDRLHGDPVGPVVAEAGKPGIDSANAPEMDKVTDSIFGEKLLTIRPVESANRRIDSFTQHKHGIAYMVQGMPGADHPYYEVAVGYDGEDRFEAYYHFLVSPNDARVLYVDAVTEDTLTLQQWEARGWK